MIVPSLKSLFRKKQLNNSNEKKFLFVCGCPRSGTSVLGKLISAHENISLGVERYGHRISPENFTLSQELFEKNRFFDVQPGDAFYSDFSQINEKYYNALKNKYDACELVGDKCPELYNSYNHLFKEFPDSTVIFIFRNIFDVAQSYKMRAEKGDDTWPKDKGVDAAVEDWNKSLHLTLEAMLKYDNIHCIAYENLFLGVPVDLKPIFKVIGAQKSEVAQNFFENRLLKKYNELESNRRMDLQADEKRHILLNADISAYKALNKSNANIILKKK